VSLRRAESRAAVSVAPVFAAPAPLFNGGGGDVSPILSVSERACSISI
jgi:hypothetical protein